MSQRRALRVPISDIPLASAADDGVEDDADENGAATDVSNVVEFDPPSGVTAAVEFVQDRDPTEPTFMTEPDPLGGDDIEIDSDDLSDPGIDVHFSDPPAQRPSSKPADAPRYSEPPEELFLDDADVLSRSDIAPPAEKAAEMMIPIPKPPPPPTESTEAKTPEVEGDEDGPWYEHFFGEAYLRTVRATTPKEVALECDFIERALRVPVGARVLDAGCGLGAQTVELAARGYHMVGLDISATMVSRAYDEAEDRGLQIDFIRGDMRDISFAEPFEALLCWGTTFGYFSEQENEQTIRQFHRALKPNGMLLLDVVNRDFMIGSQPNQVWFEVDGAVCMEETDFDYEASRLRVKRRVASHSGQQNDRHYSIRLYALHEIRALLERNGFRVDEISGREATMGIFFGVHSPKMIIRAERLAGPFAEEGNTPPPVPSTPSVPKGALRPSELPPDNEPQDE
ncbi:MAG: class I SAM-dependent methyltransferase [Myxococcales bacterium]|nr:MAG: class I SAM-dependent methyltransferase [Myxococcales bacterium]